MFVSYKWKKAQWLPGAGANLLDTRVDSWGSIVLGPLAHTVLNLQSSHLLVIPDYNPMRFSLSVVPFRGNVSNASGLENKDLYLDSLE